MKLLYQKYSRIKSLIDKLEDASNSQEIELAIKDIRDFLNQNNSDNLKNELLNSLKEKFSKLPALESIDGKSFYALMAKKKEELEKITQELSK